ncbi:uncharacterized protein L969DRAFT_85737 [Mixia osmundae IAM 14324]|uniref:G-patch domain-containing protein n=1 Tax=Mixia osmundae (strain CBS 9802 / IAM 14324 / JCM 22182 / KY 12970) TaxID=764103 RepID=G7E637_MIXOS|nr:uncharacterized protein L969DRAFT_85737 [Mixia osmundae IAM 14324]KEI40550.1 hypothetical protein L969DRAFT_85737 [Mixia osmundae IAM 14324]GAA98297.1 hypothetical protein E5Q_04981 [Mixia osmundae IAM 14324]
MVNEQDVSGQPVPSQARKQGLDPGQAPIVHPKGLTHYLDRYSSKWSAYDAFTSADNGLSPLSYEFSPYVAPAVNLTAPASADMTRSRIARPSYVTRASDSSCSSSTSKLGDAPPSDVGSIQTIFWDGGGAQQSLEPATIYDGPGKVFVPPPKHLDEVTLRSHVETRGHRGLHSDESLPIPPAVTLQTSNAFKPNMRGLGQYDKKTGLKSTNMQALTPPRLRSRWYMEPVKFVRGKKQDLISKDKTSKSILKLPMHRAEASQAVNSLTSALKGTTLAGGRPDEPDDEEDVILVSVPPPDNRLSTPVRFCSPSPFIFGGAVAIHSFAPVLSPEITHLSPIATPDKAMLSRTAGKASTSAQSYRNIDPADSEDDEEDDQMQGEKDNDSDRDDDDFDDGALRPVDGAGSDSESHGSDDAFGGAYYPGGYVLTPQERRKGSTILGKHAPKLDSDNVGYGLLEKMGWKQGDHLGRTEGASADIVAVKIKVCKSGIGR